MTSKFTATYPQNVPVENKINLFAFSAKKSRIRKGNKYKSFRGVWEMSRKSINISRFLCVRRVCVCVRNWSSSKSSRLQEDIRFFLVALALCCFAIFHVPLRRYRSKLMSSRWIYVKCGILPVICALIASINLVASTSNESSLLPHSWLWLKGAMFA